MHSHISTCRQYPEIFLLQRFSLLLKWTTERKKKKIVLFLDKIIAQICLLSG